MGILNGICPSTNWAIQTQNHKRIMLVTVDKQIVGNCRIDLQEAIDDLRHVCQNHGISRLHLELTMPTQEAETIAQTLCKAKLVASLTPPQNERKVQCPDR